MRVGAIYSFNRGQEVIEAHYAKELTEVRAAIATVDAHSLAKKVSSEKTMPGRELFDPKLMNRAFKAAFAPFDWAHHKVCVDMLIPTTRQIISRAAL